MSFTTRPRRRRPQPAPRRSSHFGFGLLFYFILTIALFELVRRMMPRIAARIGGIENGWLQFSIYFTIYVLLTAGGILAAQRVLRAWRRETLMRLCFGGAATLSLVVAAYQNRFGTGMSATYLTVGTLGAFAGALLVTQIYYGLVEVNAPPSNATVAEVLQVHRGLVLANTAWDHLKRAVEMVLSVALIVLSLPISVLLAIAIWWQDPGPLLVAKVAVTRGGRSFRQFKLRSMIKDAELQTGAVPAAPDDSRITGFGRVLRRMHIDELPQMLNIALGDMSLVGPRPERTIFVRRHLRVLPNYALRHTVRPGLAGLAQIYGDYYSTPREKLRYDLLYIRRRSFMLDLKIFVSATLLAFFGAWPGMNRGRRLFNERRQAQRYHAAYEALHGRDDEQLTPEMVAYQAPARREPAYAPALDRLPDADERTTAG